jgi:hypothetical protein
LPGERSRVASDQSSRHFKLDRLLRAEQNEDNTQHTLLQYCILKIAQSEMPDCCRPCRNGNPRKGNSAREKAAAAKTEITCVIGVQGGFSAAWSPRLWTESVRRSPRGTSPLAFRDRPPDGRKTRVAFSGSSLTIDLSRMRNRISAVETTGIRPWSPKGSRLVIHERLTI